MMGNQGMSDTSRPDRLEFEPHKRFVRLMTPAERDSYRTKMCDPVFQNAVTVAVAEMVAKGYSREEMNGVLSFIDTLLNFGENPKEVKPLPAKNLQTI